MELTSKIVPEGALVHVRFRNEREVRGYVSSVSDNLITIIREGDGMPYEITEEDLDQVQIVSILPPIPDQIVYVPLEVDTDTRITNVYSKTSGFIAGINQQFMFTNDSDFVDSNLLDLLHGNNRQQLEGSPVICGYSEEIKKRYIIGQRSVDDLLDFISEKAKDGDIFMASAFLKILIKQLPEDLDVITFKQKLQTAIGEMVIDINAPIKSNSKLYLDAMGHITSFDKGSGIGVIYDQRSHKELWFHEMQLIDPDFKDKKGNIDTNKLIGNRVLYYLKPKAMGIRSYEARSIIMPMERYKAIDLAQDLFPKYNMNLSAWGLLKAIQYQKEFDSELDELITQFEYNSYIRKNKWLFDKLPKYEGPEEKKLLYIPRNFSLNLRRTGVHQIQKYLKGRILTELIPTGDGLTNLIRIEEENRKQRQRDIEEIRSNNLKLKEENNTLQSENESLKDKIKKEEERSDEYKNKYLNLKDRFYALKEEIASERSDSVTIYEDTKDVILEPNGRIIQYNAVSGLGTMEIYKTNKNGEIQKDSTSLPILEDKIYSFTLDDIIDPQLEEQATMQSANLSERLKGIPVLCSVNSNYSATNICACDSFFETLRTVRRLITDKKINQAKTILDLIAIRLPSRPEVISLRRYFSSDTITETEVQEDFNQTSEEETDKTNLLEASDSFRKAEVLEKEGHLKEAISAYQDAYKDFYQKKTHPHVRKCICKIVGLYHNLLETVSNTEKDDLMQAYNSFGKKHMSELSKNDLQDVSASMMYFKDFKKDTSYLKMLERKAELFGEKRDKVQQADCLSSLAQLYLLCGKTKEASERAQMAHNADKSNPVAIACNSFIRYNDNKKFNPTSPNSMEVGLENGYLNIDLPDFENAYGHVHKDSTLSQVRMWLLYDIATNQSPVSLDKSLFKLSYSLLATDLSDFKAKTAIRSTDSSQFVYFTFLYLTRLLIEPEREDSWEYIMLAMALSPGAAAKLCDYLYVINEDYFRKLLARFEHPTRDKARKQLCVSQVVEWRKEILNRYNKWIALAKEQKSENKPEKFSSYLGNLEPRKWMMPKDKDYITAIQKEIPDLVMQFVNAKSSRAIIQNYEEIAMTLKNWIDECCEHPTILSEASILPTLKNLKESLQRVYEQKEFSHPTPKVSVVSIGDYDNRGDLIVEFEVCNSKSMSYPISSLSLQFTSSKVFSWPENESIFTSADDLYGGETLSFCMHARLIDTREDEIQTKLSYTLSWNEELDAQKTAKGVLNLCFHKDERTSVENYYKGFGSPVADPNMFYGRRNFIEEVLSSVMNGFQFVIYGQKRSGKTSLLDKIHAELENRSSIGKYFSIKISFGQAATESECYCIILAAISEKLTKLKKQWKRHQINIEEIPEMQIPQEYVFHEKPTNIHILLHYLKELKQTLRETKGWENCIEIFFIDEFTSVFKYIKAGSIGRNFIESWKMMQQDEDAKFTSVLVGQDSFIKFAKEYEGTRNSFGILHQKRLTYLTYSEARQFVVEPTLRAMGGKEEDVFAKGAIDRILYYSGCSTYFTMGLCKYLIDYVNLNRLKRITVPDVDEAAFSFACSPDFETIGVDALTMSGETDAVSEFNSYQTECILNFISQYENQKKGCSYEQILNEFVKKDYTNDFIDQILKDLVSREVIICYNDKYYKVKVKLYIKRYYYKWNNQNFIIPQTTTIS